MELLSINLLKAKHPIHRMLKAILDLCKLGEFAIRLFLIDVWKICETCDLHIISQVNLGSKQYR
jgi:hypothetical protein